MFRFSLCQTTAAVTIPRLSVSRMTHLTLQLGSSSASTQQQGRILLCEFWASKYSHQFTGSDLDRVKVVIQGMLIRLNCNFHICESKCYCVTQNGGRKWRQRGEDIYTPWNSYSWEALSYLRIRKIKQVLNAIKYSPTYQMYLWHTADLWVLFSSASAQT